MHFIKNESPDPLHIIVGILVGLSIGLSIGLLIGFGLGKKQYVDHPDLYIRAYEKKHSQAKQRELHVIEAPQELVVDTLYLNSNK